MSGDKDPKLAMFELYLGTAEKVSDRRIQANTWMLSVNSAIVALYGYLQADNTDLRKFLDTSVPSTSSHGSPAGTIYRAGKAGAQAMAQSERIKASSAANRFQAVSHASMMSPRLGNTELASQWLRR